MMSNQIKVLLVAFTVTAILAVVPASAVVINDFEGSAGNAIDWSSGLDIDADPNYSYAAVGVTSGSQSVRLDQCGWAQSLAFKLDADILAAREDRAVELPVDRDERRRRNSPEPGFAVGYSSESRFYG